MIVIMLDEGICVYQSAPPAGEVEGLNFMAIVEDGKALFLDTGYAANMAEALEDIARRGAAPTGAIISHYHPDHDGGLPPLPSVHSRPVSR